LNELVFKLFSYGGLLVTSLDKAGGKTDYLFNLLFKST